MSIKRMLTAQLEAIESRLSGGDKRYVTGALAMVDLLQEPTTPRRAPDYPERGQYFWQRDYDGNAALCLVRQQGHGPKLYWTNDKSGYFGEMSAIDEWYPIQLPQFTEQGHE